MKRPAFQFYPADWQKDAALQSCSIAARGLWIEMLCIMHQCEPYGYLAVNCKPITDAQLARLVGVPQGSIKRTLAELEAAGVYSKGDDGCIFSRRMVKDERLREVRAEAGKLGGNPTLLGDKDKQKVKQTDNHAAKQSLTPSSSSSSSPTEKQKNGSAFAPPEWVPADAWQGYLEMRRRIGKPLTPYACVLGVKKLEKLRDQGYEPRAVLDAAIFHSWQGLFPPKDAPVPQQSRRVSL